MSDERSDARAKRRDRRSFTHALVGVSRSPAGCLRATSPPRRSPASSGARRATACLAAATDSSTAPYNRRKSEHGRRPRQERKAGAQRSEGAEDGADGGQSAAQVLGGEADEDAGKAQQDAGVRVEGIAATLLHRQLGEPRRVGGPATAVLAPQSVDAASDAEVPSEDRPDRKRGAESPTQGLQRSAVGDDRTRESALSAGIHRHRGRRASMGADVGH